ncbi:DUF4178 domain-containing protein [Anaerolineae bacterium CFX7]|nr:DUF4178 domain-containing protein [Anaerolineae bacterium CFX7]
MGDLKQTVTGLANAIPGYTGYKSKEQRRDADRILRERLTQQYNAQRDRLTRLQQDAVRGGQLAVVSDLEGANQQLSRFISRLRTAPTGYAGWFDAATIEEADLDLIYQFDATLANGVDELSDALTKMQTAVRAKENTGDAYYALRDQVDALNQRLDAREEFLARGKRPAPSASPLGALKDKPAPQPEGANPYAQLKLNDAISYDKTDFLVAGRITYAVAAGKFYAYLLRDRDTQKWLRVGPNNELAVAAEVKFSVPDPLPATLVYDGKNYNVAEQGAANVQVEGASGAQSGAVNYHRYQADGGARLWVENWGAEIRVSAGTIVDPFEVKLYRKL